MPTPGLAILITSKPITNANVETISKYNSAIPPVLPYRFHAFHARDTTHDGAEK